MSSDAAVDMDTKPAATEPAATEPADAEPAADGFGRSRLLRDKLDAPCASALTSEVCQQMERRYVAHNYEPLPVVFDRADGVFVWDPEGRKYYDFISAYSAVNQGHCHPRIVRALVAQGARLTLSSRAVSHTLLGLFAQTLTALTGYDKMLPMNTGAEAVESAIKLARRWGYAVKKIPADQALIIVFDHNFHGRTTTIVSFSSDAESRRGFGPFPPGFVRVPYDDLPAVQAVFEDPARGAHVAAVLVEPIQGEAGVVVPADGYLAGLAALCKTHRALLIADEIQTGLGRTGKLLCCQWSGVRPDVVLLGKALSGGLLPVSAVVADAAVMDLFTPGSHGSTYGGCPIACAVGLAALQVLVDEGLPERSRVLGLQLQAALRAIQAAHPRLIAQVRGKGLFQAIVLADDAPFSGKDVAKALLKAGLITKDTHGQVLRLAPPLVITADQLAEATAIIARVLDELDSAPAAA